MAELAPTKWYQPTAAGNRVPCRWEGWVDLGPCLGTVWIVVELLGEDGDA